MEVEAKMDEIRLKNIVASPFISRGINEIDRKTFVNYLSMNMGWLSPAVVEDLIEISEVYGLLWVEDDTIKPLFDLKETSLRGFNPAGIEDDLKKENVLLDIFQFMIDTKLEKRKLIEEIKELRAKFNDVVHMEVIALLLCRRHNLEYPEINSVEESLLKD